MTQVPGLQPARKKARLTQAELAEKLHLKREAVARWENGDRAPDIATLRTLAATLDVSIEQLLNPTIEEEVA